MGNKPIVPIFQAERYHGEVVQGDYSESHNGQGYMLQKDGLNHAVKKETLKMSLDGGERFRNMEEINNLIQMGLDYDDDDDNDEKRYPQSTSQIFG